MTLLERLQSHKGGLIRIKSQLFWYGGRGWDRNPGRVCLILDASATDRRTARAAAMTTTSAAAGRAASALLLIDDRPQWIWVADKDVEVLNDPS